MSGLAVHCADARRNHVELTASLDGAAEEPLGHGAAADISRANEQNRFHPARRFKVICEWPVVNPKSGARRVDDGERLDQIHRRARTGSWIKGFGLGRLRWRGIFVLLAVFDF